MGGARRGSSEGYLCLHPARVPPFKDSDSEFAQQDLAEMRVMIAVDPQVGLGAVPTRGWDIGRRRAGDDHLGSGGYMLVVCSNHTLDSGGIDMMSTDHRA